MTFFKSLLVIMASNIKSQSEARAYLHDLREGLNCAVFEVMSTALGTSAPTLKAVAEGHDKAINLLDRFARAAEGIVRQRQAARRDSAVSKDSTDRTHGGKGKPAKKSQAPMKSKRGTRAYAAWLEQADDSDSDPLEQPWSEFHV